MIKRHQILGLDIGHFSAKAVLASLKGGDVIFEKAAILRLPQGGLERASMLSRWLKENGLTGGRCVTCLSGQDTMFQPMFMIPGDPRTIEQAAAMEMLKLREIAADEMTHGIASFGGPTGERRALLAVVRPSLVSDTTQMLRNLHLEPTDIVPSPVALYNAQATAAPGANGPRIYAHIGYSVTEFAVGGDNGLMFARAFAAGGQIFTDAIARAKRLAGPQAENLKMTGEYSLRQGDETVVAALEKAAANWVAELQSAIAVFGSLFPRPADRPRDIVLSGGGSLVPGFAEFIQTKVGLPVVRCDRLPGSGTHEPAAVWILAAGLAASALVPPRCTLSLLPQVIKDEQFFRAQKPYWIAAGAVAALIPAVILLGGYHDYKRMAKHLQEQRASLERRRELVSRIESIQSRNVQIRESVQPISDLLRSIPLTRQLLALVADAKDPNDWITLVCDGTSYYSKRPSAILLPPDAGNPTDRRRRVALTALTEATTNRVEAMNHVIIEGYTRKGDFSTVQKLIARIEAADFVRSADLLSDDKLVNPEASEERLQDTASRRFVVSVKLIVP